MIKSAAWGLILFATGMVTGWLTSESLHNVSGGAQSEITAPRVSSNPTASPRPRESTSSPTLLSANRALVDDEWLGIQSKDDTSRRKALTNRAVRILSTLSPSDRLRQFAALMDFMRPGDFAAMIEAFHFHDQAGRIFHPEFEMMIHRAGQVGDAGPMEMARGNQAGTGARDRWANSVMKEWTSNHPQEAVAWWNALPDGPFRDELARAVIGGLAVRDPDMAWDYTTKFPSERRAEFARLFFDQTLQSGGIEDASNWISKIDTLQLDDPESLKTACVRKLREVTWNIPTERIGSLMEPFARETYALPALIEHVQHRFGKDPDIVANWVGSLAGTPNYPKLREVLLEKWMQTDPSAAAAWTAKEPASQ